MRVRPDELPDAVSTVIVDAPAFGDADGPVDVAGFARGRRLLVEVVDRRRRARAGRGARRRRGRAASG
ncbi:hypothetical protein BJF79_23820 [Actinomadura sp. CNU-125]|nr:hypothetical protein BJF79_23820 [Actinomadura sp. CNU-125]